MVHTVALIDKAGTGHINRDTPVKGLLQDQHVQWFWADFDDPDEDEVRILLNDFHFHALAVEDCLYNLERPKLDHYKDHDFYVIQSLDQKDLSLLEIDIFTGGNYIVTVHKNKIEEIKIFRDFLLSSEKVEDFDCPYLLHKIFDMVVDLYFPAVYKIEDEINSIDIREAGRIGSKIQYSMIDSVFEIRARLLMIRRIVYSMRDLLYKILESSNLKFISDNKDRKVYYNDIYDHLMKLYEIVESNREMTADMRDSYMSMVTHRMNTIMTILTIITTIFIPTTFVAGIYGMNFVNMPELKWKYGYYIILGVMAVIGAGMFVWFKRKNWLKIYKQ